MLAQSIIEAEVGINRLVEAVLQLAEQHLKDPNLC
jgi:enhancing lycopene biosynthesis protein 2